MATTKRLDKPAVLDIVEASSSHISTEESDSALFRFWTHLLNRLNYPRKFALITLLFTLPIALLISLIYAEIGLVRHTTQQELAGLDYIRITQELLIDVQAYRQLSILYADGDAVAKDRLTVFQQETEQAFKRGDALQERYDKIFKVTEMWSGLKDKWNTISSQGLTQNPNETVQIYADLIADIHTLTFHVSDVSKLTLDTDIESHYLIDSLVNKIPTVLETVGQIRELGYKTLVRGVCTPEDRARLTLFGNAIRLAIANLQRGYETVFQNSKIIKDELEPKLDESLGANSSFLVGNMGVVRAVGKPNISSEEFLSSATDAMDKNAQLFNATTVVVERLLQARIRRLMRKQNLILLAVLLVLGVVAQLYWAFYRTVMRTAATLKRTAKGDLSAALMLENQDEMGEACREMAGSLGELLGEITSNTQALSGAAEELTAVSAQMSSTAEQSASQANLVSSAAEQISQNVQTVAAGSEELSSSIKEIARNALEAANVAGSAVAEAQVTHQAIAELHASSAEIGQVIKIINSIAEQTNLLALNATIEAARAGDAGKGFAVVANEVKELAKETAKATGSVAKQIQMIQERTQSAVTAITKIKATIDKINETQNSIAGAAEEQTATTREMGRNISNAAKGTAEIAHNIVGVAKTAQDASSGARDNRQLAANLAKMAADLQKLINRFKVSNAPRPDSR